MEVNNSVQSCMFFFFSFYFHKPEPFTFLYVPVGGAINTVLLPWSVLSAKVRCESVERKVFSTAWSNRF